MAWQLIASPIIGAIGAIANTWLDIKKEKIKAEERAAERTHELLVMDRENEYAKEKLTIEAEMQREKDAGADFRASHENNNSPILPKGTRLNTTQTWLALGVDSLAAIIRPIATIYYQLALIGVMAWSAHLLVKVGMPLVEQTFAQELMRDCVYSIVGMAELTCTWWFGARGLSKRGK